MTDSPARRRSLIFPVLVLLLAGGLSAWLLGSGHTMRSVGSLILAFLAFLLISLWWALGAKGQRLKRLFFLALIGGLLGVSASRVLRYTGSADGTAMPQLTWTWSKTQAPATAALHTQTPAANATDLGPLPAGLADWTRYLGPKGDGMLPAPTWQTDWKAHPPREVWRQPVGLGWSGFSVAGRRAITLEQRGEEECITCYDVVTGKLLWSHADKARFSEPMGGDGPRSTPTLDPATNAVFTVGAIGLLNCLDLTTGALRWTRDVLQDAKAANQMYGRPGSPLLVAGMVVVTGGDKAPNLLAYRQDTGEPVWQSSGDDVASYSAPVVRTLAGKEQILSVNQTSASGHDIATGKRLWYYPWPGNFPKVGQPLQISPGTVLVTSSYGQKCHLLDIRTNPSGGYAATAIWTENSPRTKFSSATLFGNQAIAIDEGTLAGVDVTTGERLWREGRYGFGQHLQLGDLLLVQAEPGDVVLLRASTDKPPVELSRIKNALTSKTWNPPAIAGHYLLIRNDREAVCYELQ